MCLTKICGRLGLMIQIFLTLSASSHILCAKAKHYYLGSRMVSMLTPEKQIELVIREDLCQYADPICRDVSETDLPSFQAINHAVPLIDKSKINQLGINGPVARSTSCKYSPSW